MDTRAPQGQTGSWLLDPTNLTIAGGAAPAGTPAIDTVYENDLEASTSDIHLQAQDSIGVAGTFSDNAIRIAGFNVKLETVGSTGGTGINLVVEGSTPQGIVIETGGTGSIELRTAGSGQSITTGELATSGGNITVQAGGQVNMGHILVDSNGGNISIQGGNTSQTTGPGVNIYNTSTIKAGAGNVSINGSSYSSPGVQLAGSTNGPTTVTGKQVTISGQTLMGTTALRLDTASVSTSDSLNMSATDGSLQLNTSKVSNSGTGPTTLTSAGNANSGINIDGGSDVSTTASEIHLTTNSIKLDGTMSQCGQKWQGGDQTQRPRPPHYPGWHR